MIGLLLIFCISTLTFSGPTQISDLTPQELKKNQDAREEMVQEDGLERLREKSQRIEALALEEESQHQVFPTLDLMRHKEAELFRSFSLDDLQLFGRDVFQRVHLELSRIPLHQRKVPDQYPLGPGDRLSIHVWNQTQDQIISGEVNARGRIHFPLAGEIKVQGIRKQELEAYLLRKLEPFYRDLKISFDLVQLRQFPVYVTGEARVPGVFIGSALSTPLQLLMANGGPNHRGSFRSVRLLRDGKLVQVFDFYNFLLHGTLESQFFLEAEDVLHIPLSQKRVAVVGRVKRQSIFELQSDEHLKTALEFAGGLEADADRNLVQVLSFDALGKPQVRDLKLSSTSDAPLSDGSIILIHPTQNPLMNKVEIFGNIYKPGTYQWTQGMTVSDLVQRSQGQKRDTYLPRAEIHRHLEKHSAFRVNRGIEALTYEELVLVHLGDELSGKSATVLSEGDRLQVFSLSEVQVAPSIEVMGVVNKPGVYPLSSDARIKDVLFQAQLNSNSYMLRGELHRQSLSGMKILSFQVAEALENIASENLSLENGDVISIFENPEQRLQGRIELKGMLKFPGVYPFILGEKLADVLERAGGMTEHGFWRGAQFLRQSVQARQRKTRDLFVEREKKSLNEFQTQAYHEGETQEDREVAQKEVEGVSTVLDRLASAKIEGRIHLDFSGISDLKQFRDSRGNLLLEDGDRFILPSIPSEVSVVGQVYSPSTVLHNPKFSIEDYLNLSGGLTESSYSSRMYIIRADGSATPARALKKRTRGLRFVSSFRAQKGANLRGGLEIGDTLVVPTRFKIRKDLLKETLDMTYKLAISIGALAGVFK
jgi:protein involved in polysaccharide export with SLBB domain